MNIQEFNEILNSLKLGSLQQEMSEWRIFLEFVEIYFKNRNIANPLIVEIGTYNNVQKIFYERLLNAEHIGVDIKQQPNAPALDILGDSHIPETVEKLKSRLAGRKIDLLFIDGDHSYESVKSDYKLYGPLTKHIIALHDINTIRLNPRNRIGVIEFWKELLKTDKQNTLCSIQHYNPSSSSDVFNPGRQMGIGLVIKGNGA